MERDLEDWVYQIQAGQVAVMSGPEGWVERVYYGFEAVRDIAGKVWFYVVLALLLGPASMDMCR
jgi:uncharacterized protein